MNSNNDTDKFRLSHLETFNKYLLAISSAAFPAVGYLILQEKGGLVLFKIALAFFATAIILNMTSLFIIVDYPTPKGNLDKFICYTDLAAFILFCVAVILTWIGMLLI